MWASVTGSFRRVLAGMGISLSLLLAACGGGGGDAGSSAVTAQGCSSSSCGTALINVMDADGDFLSYTVDVVSLTLKKANGTVVETLPVQPRIDFTDLVDVKELLTAATVPNGDYVSGTLRLDYSNADIEVEQNGLPVKATPVDSNGQPVTTLDLDLELDNNHHLVIAPGTPSLLELDFDLASSNTVDLTQNPVQVTVQPVMMASVNIADSRDGRVRGPLKSVDTAGSSYKVDVRPFRHATARLGEVTVHTTSMTTFEIDGTTYTGAAGLTALAALAVDTPTAAFGSFSTTDRAFTASRVRAGSSVQSAQFDAIEGTVIARSGDQLTVRGATLIRKTGGFVFERGDVAVTVGANTKVTKEGVSGTTLDIGAISVGQRVNVFGQATEGASSTTLDATAGRVRLQLTHVAGMVTNSTAGTLTMNVQTIDHRRISIFNFAGTGVSPSQDADPAHYEVSTTLDLTNFTAGVPAQVFGFAEPFGTAPPDFEGRTLADYRDARANLVMGWGLAGTSAPFTAADSGGIVIDIANTSIGARHFIQIGPTVTNILTLSSGPRIVPDTQHDAEFAIGEPHKVQVYESFADFTAALNAKLSGGQKMIGLTATGTFSLGTGDFTARRVLAIFKAAT